MMTAYLFQNNIEDLPSGKRLHSHGTSPSLIGKSTINVPCSIAMLNYQRVWANNQNLRPTNANELVLCSLKQSYLSTKHRRLFTTSDHQSICEWVVVIHPTRGNLAMKIDRQYGFYHRMFDCNMLYIVLYIYYPMKSLCTLLKTS